MSSLPTCHHCKQIINESKFIRIGQYTFHSQHFVCSVCNTNLASSKKIYPLGGKFYCLKDFLTLRPDCTRCSEKIIDQVITVGKKYYHPNCFKCRTCDRILTTKYYIIQNEVFCHLHQKGNIDNNCAVCGTPISSDHLVKASGRCYHQVCYFCHHCHKDLCGSKMSYPRDGHVFCKEDFQKLYLSVCTACGEYIWNQPISINGEHYHYPQCFKCGTCSQKITSYKWSHGALRCSTHFNYVDRNISIPCDYCNTNITGDIICCCGKKVHKECFKCSYCDIDLNKETTKLLKKHFICPNCIVLLEIGPPKTFRQPPPRITPSALANASAPPANLSVHNRADSKISRRHSVDIEVKQRKESQTPPPTANSMTPKVTNRKYRKASHQPLSFDKNITWTKGSLIGKGSFGKVFMAMNDATGELIAVKEVDLGAVKDDSLINSIKEEIELMKKITHPHIVHYFQSDVNGHKLSILMEFVPGKSIDYLLQTFGSFKQKTIQKFVYQILGALEYLHDNNIIHRDIKGKNILVDTKGNTKICDFGSAKQFQDLALNMEVSVSYNYTPLWTAPEVLIGNYSKGIDIWSLGCVIIEMATAKTPWAECNFDNPFRALYHIGNSGQIPQLPTNLDPIAIDFLKLCLNRNPEQRHSATQLLQHPWMLESQSILDNEREMDEFKDVDKIVEQPNSDDDEPPGPPASPPPPPPASPPPPSKSYEPPSVPISNRPSPSQLISSPTAHKPNPNTPPAININTNNQGHVNKTVMNSPTTTYQTTNPTQKQPQTQSHINKPNPSLPNQGLKPNHPSTSSNQTPSPNPNQKSFTSSPNSHKRVVSCTPSPYNTPTILSKEIKKKENKDNPILNTHKTQRQFSNPVISNQSPIISEKKFDGVDNANNNPSVNKGVKSGHVANLLKRFQTNSN